MRCGGLRPTVSALLSFMDMDTEVEDVWAVAATATASEERELLKIALDHGRAWMILHADQRLRAVLNSTRQCRRDRSSLTSEFNEACISRSLPWAIDCTVHACHDPG